MTSVDPGWTTLSPFPQDLLSVKHTQHEAELYPNHGFARGGVGVLLATGARAGLSRLPASSVGGRTGQQHASSGRPSTSSSFTGVTSSTTGSFTSTTARLREWEKGYGHMNNFQSACRSARTHDVPSANRWATLSFYENDPAYIKRHIDIMNALEHEDGEDKQAKRDATSSRLNAMASQQREAFRRQRLEQAVRYVRAGLPPRASTPLVIGATTGSMSDLDSPQSPMAATADASTLSGNALAKAVADLSTRVGTVPPLPSTPGASQYALRSFSAPASLLHRTISLPPPSFHRVYDRMADEKAQAPRVLANQLAAAAQKAAAQRDKWEADEQVSVQLEEFEMNMVARNKKERFHLVK